jgi:hypothetical protein
MTLSKCANSLGLQVQSVVAREFSPTRVTWGLISNSRGINAKLLQALSSNLQRKFLFCAPNTTV